MGFCLNVGGTSDAVTAVHASPYAWHALPDPGLQAFMFLLKTRILKEALEDK